MKQRNNKKSLTILSLILLISVIASSFSFASFIPEDVIYNKIYDNGDFFSSGDEQSFYVPNEVNLTSLKVIGKASSDFVITQPFLYLRTNNETTNTSDTLITSKGSLKALSNNYFKEITFDLEGITLEEGYYWLELNTVGGLNYYYSDTSTQDTYIKGGINNISSSKDLYFVFTGNFVNASNTEETIQKELTDEILGDDTRIRNLVGIGILIGILSALAIGLKNDLIGLIGIILVAVLIYLIGIISFYLAGFIIIADIISYMYGGKNENK